MRNRKLATLTGIVLLLVLSGCSASTSLPSNMSNPTPAGHSTSVKVVVTTDFSKEVLLEQTIEIEPGTSAIDALKMVAKVETKYGGGFINAINGISSEYEGTRKEKKDWFLFINGISSNVGAKDYILRDGDIEHWDFRDWSYRQFIPAIIGDFPQPLLGGYQNKVKPTVIVYGDRFEESARSLVEKLNELGVKETSVQNFGQLTEKSQEQSNLILLGTKDEELISELNDNYNKLGFYAYFDQEKLVVLDARGEVVSEYVAGSGLIQATQNPWNPKGIGSGESVVWVVSGTDEDGVKNAIQALTSRYADFQYAYAVVITEGKIVRVPQ